MKRRSFLGCICSCIFMPTIAHGSISEEWIHTHTTQNRCRICIPMSHYINGRREVIVQYLKYAQSKLGLSPQQYADSCGDIDRVWGKLPRDAFRQYAKNNKYMYISYTYSKKLDIIFTHQWGVDKIPHE